MERLINSKWIATVATIWIQCSVGGAYTFSIYSAILKSTQNYDQSKLSTVAVVKEIGGCTGVLAGLLYSFVTLDRHRSNAASRIRCFCGPWVVLMTGAILSFVGYFFMWASVVGLIHRPPVALMCLFMFTAAQSHAFSITAGLVTGVRNFPAHVGTIVGMLEGYLGLSGAILIQVYGTLFEGNPSNYLLFLAVFTPSVSLLLMYFVRIHDINSEDDKKHLNALSVAALIMVAYFMILIISENIFMVTMVSWVRIVTFIFLLLLLIPTPLGIAFKAQMEDTERLLLLQTFSTKPIISLKKISTSVVHDPMEYHDHELPVDTCQENDHDSTFDDILILQKDMNLQQAICTENFWLLFIAMICGLGTGVATIDNINQVGVSLGYTSTEINSLVSLLCIWNFLGRFMVGYVSDMFLQRRGLARPLFIAITQAALSVGYIVIASGFPKNLYVGMILVGACWGSQWPLLTTIISEIFGVTHLGTVFNTISIASPIGSYIFSVRVFGYIYDKAAASSGGDKNNSCSGTHCFMLSFIILAFFALCGSLIALLLFFRTRRFYNYVVLTRLRQSYKI
ncbi:hypothetical protein Ddye_002495 [Dipteronia dyeriana]|uniref:Major facilitator superfamily (MFS) profile domain-containing protein n=1 Tax=Dipteronia dyeriana TaxID=168575 RepID=A0AAD9XR18_9ROSI|nr:hypothetical protein Ddye_002495 [Dipteronia dyeriana]